MVNNMSKAYVQIRSRFFCDIKELVFRKLYARELVLGLKRPIILSEVRLYWTLYISLRTFFV